MLAQAVATRIRTRLGGSPDAMPHADSMLGALLRDSASRQVWSGGLHGAELRVVMRRAGGMSWPPALTSATPAITLLDRALAEAKDSGDVFVADEQFTSDSLPFTLGYAYGVASDKGKVLPQAYGPPTMVAFMMRYQVEKQAATVPGTLWAEYPDAARHGRANAVVTLQFVVDTTGRADLSTVRDLWPKDLPRLTGLVGDYYAQFVTAATDGVRRARFYPAEIAGCKVKQLVQLPFTWTLKR
ncbi:hypothetical protein tb265_26730 [Gemmatimonadetes bacterium T265]|nr:hypothetical protein tb265_26730 [Gemmatimonadetes bacterium T265]